MTPKEIVEILTSGSYKNDKISCSYHTQVLSTKKYGWVWMESDLSIVEDIEGEYTLEVLGVDIGRVSLTLCKSHGSNPILRKALLDEIVAGNFVYYTKEKDGTIWIKRFKHKNEDDVEVKE